MATRRTPAPPAPPDTSAPNTPTRGGRGRGASRPETRRLPMYRAGAVDIPVEILSASEVFEHDTIFRPHAHPTHELIWNERGASTCTIGHRVRTLTPTIGLWIPAGTAHAGRAPAGTWQRSAQFSLRTAAVSAQPVGIRMTPLLRLLLRGLEDTDLAESSRSLTEAMVLDVVVPVPREILVDVPTDALLAPIVEAVRSDPADATTLAQWAERLGVSERTITRAFTAATGLGYRAWTTASRTQHAALLLGTDMPLDDVARAVGFASTSAFIATFRRVTGETPGRLRS